MLTLEDDGILAEIECLPCYSIAIRRAGFDLVGPATLTNLRRDRFDGADAFLTLNHLDAKWRIEVPSLDVGESLVTKAQPERFEETELESVTHPVAARLTLRLGSGERSLEVALLSAWQWPLARYARTAAAAYVLPNDGIVRDILSGALAGSGLPGRSGLSAEEWSRGILRALYGYVRDTYRIVYSEPIVVETRWSPGYQFVRPPHRMILAPRDRAGEGTCFDLSLLLAGCLEGAGLAPVLILSGALTEVPSHALVGCWSCGRHQNRPLIAEGPTVLSWIRRGELLVVESTGVCGGDRSLEFDESMARALEYLTRLPALHLIDVLALRPPIGRVGPLEQALDPVVLRSYREAAAAAVSFQTPVLETIHLLYGIIQAEGELTSRLLEGCGVASADVLGGIAQRLSRKRKGVRPGKTITYEHSMAAARENALVQGSTVVREQDLWWALLGAQSQSIDRVFEHLGTSRAALIRELSLFVPPPGPVSASWA